MNLLILIHGHDGNVGRAIAAGCAKEGWAWRPFNPGDLLPADNFVVVDAGPPGADGWGMTWSNLFHAAARAASLINCLNGAPACAGLVLCSSEWVIAQPAMPYSMSKWVIEQMAHAHNMPGMGSFPVIVDRIGMQQDPGPTFDRFSESVRNAPGELAERVIAALLNAIEARKAK